MSFDRVRLRLGVVVWVVVATATACSPRQDVTSEPQPLTVGQPMTVFAVSTRAREADGNYGWERSAIPDLLEITVSIPPDRESGSLSYGGKDPDPNRDFLIADSQLFSAPSDFRTRLKGELASLPAGSKEMMIFVHGYNSTQSETIFRVAQVANDIGVPGVKSIYSWPSYGTPLGYVYDNDSMLFARDGLEDMLEMAVEAGPERIVLVAHSMGAQLTMETLRQIELERPGWTSRNIGGVMLIAPDLDIEVFRQQVLRIQQLPQPFMVFISSRDPALSLSALVRGRPKDKRLGNLSTNDQVADLPITIIDTTTFSNDASSPHMVLATSPTLIALLRDVASTTEMIDSQVNLLASELPVLQTGAMLAGDAR